MTVVVMDEYGGQTSQDFPVTFENAGCHPLATFSGYPDAGRLCRLEGNPYRAGLGWMRVSANGTTWALPIDKPQVLKHADKLIQRIFMLYGLPNLQDLNKLLVGEHTSAVIACDLKLEQVSQATCEEAITYCESVRDFVSREILVDILDGTEDYIDWLEIQLGLIDKIGIENYQQSGIGSMNGPVGCRAQRCAPGLW
ncbi:bacterioferritin [Caballeronia sp. LjRoot34]|uniref:ferritin-like domain-containing protein n=1 Tax=Caballeronia sp. LjRoot34 TaxID=3342325 RepID=UPI003ED0C4CB